MLPRRVPKPEGQKRGPQIAPSREADSAPGRLGESRSRSRGASGHAYLLPLGSPRASPPRCQAPRQGRLSAPAARAALPQCTSPLPGAAPARTPQGDPVLPTAQTAARTERFSPDQFLCPAPSDRPPATPTPGAELRAWPAAPSRPFVSLCAVSPLSAGWYRVHWVPRSPRHRPCRPRARGRADSERAHPATPPHHQEHAEPVGLSPSQLSSETLQATLAKPPGI